MKLLLENWRAYLDEAEAKLTAGQVKALQAVKSGQELESHAGKSLTFQKLIDMGFIEGEVSRGTSQSRITGGWKQNVERSVENMKITLEGESALSASLSKSVDKLTQAKTIIMQAIIDGGGSVPVKDLPTWKGYNQHPFLRGAYWKAWEALYYDDYAINWGEDSNTIIPHKNFDKVKGELGL